MKLHCNVSESRRLQLWVDNEICVTLSLLMWEESKERWKNSDEDDGKQKKRKNCDRLHRSTHDVLLQFSCTYSLSHSHSYTKAPPLDMLFVCRLLSTIIAVTFIFAPEACLPVSITWKPDLQRGRLRLNVGWLQWTQNQMYLNKLFYIRVQLHVVWQGHPQSAYVTEDSLTHHTCIND